MSFIFWSLYCLSFLRITNYDYSLGIFKHFFHIQFLLPYCVCVLCMCMCVVYVCCVCVVCMCVEYVCCVCVLRVSPWAPCLTFPLNCSDIDLFVIFILLSLQVVNGN